MIRGLRNLSYEQKKEVSLFSLSKQRMRGDPMEVFKRPMRFRNINAEHYLTIDLSHRTKINSNFRISGKTLLLHEAKHFLFKGVVHVWNSAPCRWWYKSYGPQEQTRQVFWIQPATLTLLVVVITLRSFESWCTSCNSDTVIDFNRYTIDSFSPFSLKPGNRIWMSA